MTVEQVKKIAKKIIGDDFSFERFVEGGQNSAAVFRGNPSASQEESLARTLLGFSDNLFVVFQDKLKPLGNWMNKLFNTKDESNNVIKVFVSFNDQSDGKNEYAMAIKTHDDDKSPFIEIGIEKLDEWHLGGLMQFMVDTSVRYSDLLSVR